MMNIDEIAQKGRGPFGRLSTFLQVTIYAKEDYNELKEIVLKLEQKIRDSQDRNSQDKLQAIELIKIYNELLHSVDFLENENYNKVSLKVSTAKIV